MSRTNNNATVKWLSMESRKKKKKIKQEGYSPQQGLQQSVPKGTSTPTDHIKWAYIFTILLNEAMYITTACSTHLHRFTSRLSSTSTAVSSRSGPGGPGDREKKTPML